MVTTNWPPHAHSGDPETSHEAAELLDPTRGIEAVVRFYAENDRPEGWARMELLADAKLNSMHVRNNGLYKRLSDAERLGFVDPMFDDDGHLVTRISPYNRRQRALRITDAGRGWLAGGDFTVAPRRSSRKPKVAVLSVDEVAAIGRLRLEHSQTSIGGWVVIQEGHVRTLLALLDRLTGSH